MNQITSKFKEVIFSVIPIFILVIILNFTLVPIENDLIAWFFVGTIFVIIGLTVFLIGVDIGITPFGEHTGKVVAKSNNIWIVLIAGVFLGFLISIAEPGLIVLSNQVDLVTSGQISSFEMLIVVSIGLSILLSLGFFRIFYNLPLHKILIVLYIIIFGLALLSSREFLAISFDASGSTTGILAVPFILSLSVGISKLKKDSKASEKDSFGLIAIASTGAIISVLLLGIFDNTYEFVENSGVIVDESISIISFLLQVSINSLKDSTLALIPLAIILMILQKLVFNLKKRDFRKVVTGFSFAFIGLLLFLFGVNAGFMSVGSQIGNDLAMLDNKSYIIIIGFIIGFVIVLAEPAVYVLTHQIEDVTSGYIKRNIVLVPLAIGVGISVALSVIRILVPSIQLWHYLLPGYFISLLLMFFTPKLFVGIAFDAGGVATGPMTATFILAFIQGAAATYEGASLIVDGFGMIAMVAMTPIITLEILGLIYKGTSKKGVIKNV